MNRTALSYSSFIKGVDEYNKTNFDKAKQYFLQSLNQGISNSKAAQNKAKPNQAYLSSSISFAVYSNLASCSIKLKQYEFALQLCIKSLQSNPYVSLPYYNMASIYIRQQQYKKAISSINCALSCEYLRKYQENFDKNCLDRAIALCANNQKAIKYRIAQNFNFLNCMQHGMTSDKMSTDFILSEKNVVRIKTALRQLQQDLNQDKKWRKIYETQFYHPSYDKSIKKPNLFISSIKSLFILESSASNNQERPVMTKQMALEMKLLDIYRLKELRSEYLKLLQSQDLQLKPQTQFCELLSLVQRNGKQKQYFGLNHFDNLAQIQPTLQTSFELQDSSQKPIVQKNNNIIKPSVKPIKNKWGQRSTLNMKNNAKDKQNINVGFNKNSSFLINPKAKKKQNSKLSKPLQINLHYANDQNEQSMRFASQQKFQSRIDDMNSSIISILDYEEGSNNENVYYSPKNRLTNNLVQSIIVGKGDSKSNLSFNNVTKTKSIKTKQLGSSRNKSFENLFGKGLFSHLHDSKLNPNEFQDQTIPEQKRMLLQSKSHYKLLSCSKCSIDHDHQQSKPKNVKLNINLTEIYNYDVDFTQLQTYCIVKHNGQEHRTELSKGKFPNWKQPILFHVENIEAGNFKDDLTDDEKFKIKIQLWTKPDLKKQSKLQNSSIGQQLLGTYEFDLRREKWAKRKIVIQNQLTVDRKKAAAYMYIGLEKIKQ